MTTLAPAGPSDRIWMYLVVLFIGLNAFDLGMTLRLVDLGAVELNPIMASVIGAGRAWAIVFKASITVGVAAGLWFGRRHRIVRQSGAAFVVLFAVLAIYQLVNILTI